MKVKNILITVALVLGFGGIVANTTLGIVNQKKNDAQVSALRSDMEAADEANKLAVEEKINQARADLNAAYEAAEATLAQNLAQTKTALEAADAAIQAQLEAGDQALANAIVARVTNLQEQVQALADAATGGQTDIADEVALIEAAISAMQDDISTLGSISSIIAELLVDALEDLSNVTIVANDLSNTVSTLAQALEALENAVDGNYYTIAQVNGLVDSTNTAIATVRDLFKDASGNIVAMKDLLEDLDVAFATINDRLDQAELDIEELQSAIGTANDVLDQFYGDEAKAAKAQYIVQMWKEIDGMEFELNSVYAAIVDAYGGVLNVPTAATELKDNLLARINELSRSVCYEGQLYITLAKTADEAEEAYVEAVGKLDSLLDELRFVLDKKEAYDKVREDLVTTFDSTLYVNYEYTAGDPTTAGGYYEAKVDAVNYVASSLEGKTLAERRAYYDDLKDQLKVIMDQATGYNALVTYNKDIVDDMDAYAVTPNHLTSTQVASFKEELEDYNALDAYTALVEADDAVVDEVVENLEKHLDLISYICGAYDAVEAERQNSQHVIDFTNDVSVEDMATLTADLNTYVNLDTYKAAALAEADIEDVDGSEDAIDEIAETAVTNAKYIANVATTLDQLIGKKITVTNNINITDTDTVNEGIAEYPAVKAVFTDAVADLLPTLAEVYTATGKDTDDQFAEVTDFDDYKEAIMDEMEAVDTLAGMEDEMIADADASKKAIDAFSFTNSEAGTAEANYLKALVDATLAEYRIVKDGEVDGKDDNTLYADIITTKTTEQGTLEDHNEAIVDAAETIDAAITAAKVLNAKIEQKTNTFKNSFLAAYNNANGDGVTVYENHEDEIAALQEAHEYDYGTATGTDEGFILPEIDPSDNYDDIYQDFLDFVDDLNTYMDTTFGQEYDEFETAIEGMLAGMINEYKDLEAAYTLARKAMLAGDPEDSTDMGYIGDLYEAAKTAAASDAVKLEKLAVVFETYRAKIMAAESSKQAEDLYLNGAYADMCTILGAAATGIASFGVIPPLA
ncbi:MAG: hypothetical protein MJ217_00445 [Bacilli bacterium]|nr:hypothetical protein [Bacilli bacterium]